MKRPIRYQRITATAVMVAGVFTVLNVIALRDPLFMPTDLGMWLDDIHSLQSCLQQSWSSACPQISKLAIGYLANSALLQPMRDSTGNPITGVQILQSAALTLPVLAMIGIHSRLRHGLALSGFYLGLLLLTPLPTFYLRSGSLEVQSGAFLGMAMLLGLQKLKQPERPLAWFSNLFVLAGCLYKDPNAVTFGACVILAGLLSRERWWRFRLMLRLWGPGLLSALVISGLWNLFRYHSLLPQGYVEEATLNRPSISQALFSLWGLFLSPNGGFVVFWGAAFAGLILVMLFTQPWPGRWPGLGTWLPLTVLIVGVSSMALWWSPFGWVSWGARLSVPFCLSALIATLGQLEDPLRLRGWNRDRLRLFGMLSVTAGALVLFARSLPYVALGYTRPRISFFVAPPTKHPQKSCTAHMFEEMAQQKHPHPNVLVNMWRTKTFWPCLEKGMLGDPTR